MPATPQVGFVSLGCPKASVDSEHILTQLRAEGYLISKTYQDADLVVVNTCGFVDSAVQESLDAIGEALKENGKVIVTGCMGVEEGNIRNVHPSVLAVTGPQQYEQVVNAVHQVVPPRQDHNPLIDLVPDMGRRVAHGGRAILSGILTTQADEVIAAYAKGGLALESRDDYGDWSTLVVRRA